MAGCKTENWTVKDLSDALQNNHKDGKRIVVPMFQRGQRWKKNQQQTFIDSLIKGYPVGTLLFYEKYEDNQWNYILVDGLQRGNCIRNYMTNPTEFFYDDNISDKTCEDILSIIGDNNKDSYIKIKNLSRIYSSLISLVKYANVSANQTTMIKFLKSLVLLLIFLRISKIFMNQFQLPIYRSMYTPDQKILCLIFLSASTQKALR